MGFTKVFSAMLDSSIWVEDADVRLAWITLLLMANKHGEVYASIPGLANRARIPLPKAREAIEKFLEPDEFSRSTANEGRRVELIDGGWRLLNYEHYRQLRHEEDERERKRQVAAERRQREREAAVHGRPQESTVAESSGSSASVAQECATTEIRDQTVEIRTQNSEPIPAKRASAPAPPRGGNDLTRWWDQEWERTRLGVKYGWQKADAVALASCVKMAGDGGAAEVKARITRCLDMPDTWVAQNATPRLLLSQWNKFAVTIVPLTSAQRKRLEADAFFDRLEAKELANGTP